MKYQGLEVICGTLYFEGVQVAELWHTSLTASQRADLETLVRCIAGMPSDEVADAVRAYVSGTEDDSDDD